ncbi:MAG: Rieske (2Fe-2S) protein [Planctomycetaceae bacterium]
MPEFQTVARVGEIPEGEGRAYEIDGRMVAVFLVEGQYSAILDACSHMGASLASGHVERGGVMCPWHAWRFCVKSGQWLDNPQSKLRQPVYTVRVVDGDIQVASPEPPAPEPLAPAAPSPGP